MTDRRTQLLMAGHIKGRRVQEQSVAAPPMLERCGITREDYLQAFARVTHILQESMLGDMALSQRDKVALGIAANAMAENCRRAGFRDYTEFRLEAREYHQKEAAREVKSRG